MSPTFWRQSANPIGVDLGTFGVKLVQLRHGRAGTHVVAAARERYERPLPDDVGERRRIVGDAVRAALASAPFEGRSCVMSPVPSDLMVRAVRLPRMSDEELFKAAQWEAADRFGLEVEEMQVEWIRAGEVVQGEDQRDEVILLAIRRDQIEAQLESLLDARLLPTAVDAPAAAVVRSLNRQLRRQADQKTVRMIVDIGSLSSTVVITRGQEIAFLKPISVGGSMFTQAVAEALDLEEGAALDLRGRRMAANDGGERAEIDERVDRAVFDAVRPMMHDLAQEAALCLRYYSVTFRGVRPEETLVVGGDGPEPGLCELFEEALNVPTSIGKPLDGVDLSTASLGLDRRRSACPEWAVAAGLSMYDGSNRARRFARKKAKPPASAAAPASGEGRREAA